MPDGDAWRVWSQFGEGEAAMTQEQGAIPFETVTWDLVPGRTVVVVIDPQNDFLHSDGWYAQKGIDISHMRRCHSADINRDHRRARQKRIAPQRCPTETGEICQVVGFLLA